MHMRSEFPPLCGRDHLSFRSYYFPVKVGLHVCVSCHLICESLSDVQFMESWAIFFWKFVFFVCLSRMWLTEICVSSLTVWTLTNRKVWQKSWTERHPRSLRNWRTFALATPSNRTPSCSRGGQRHTDWRTRMDCWVSCGQTHTFDYMETYHTMSHPCNSHTLLNYDALPPYILTDSIMVSSSHLPCVSRNHTHAATQTHHYVETRQEASASKLSYVARLSSHSLRCSHTHTQLWWASFTHKYSCAKQNSHETDCVESNRTVILRRQSIDALEPKSSASKVKTFLFEGFFRSRRAEKSSYGHELRIFLVSDLARRCFSVCVSSLISAKLNVFLYRTMFFFFKPVLI